MKSCRVADNISQCDVYVLAGGLGTQFSPSSAIRQNCSRQSRDGYTLKYCSIGCAVSTCSTRCLDLAMDRTYSSDTCAIIRSTTCRSRPSRNRVPLVLQRLRLASAWLRSDPVLVINGDSIVDADLAAFLSFIARSSRLLPFSVQRLATQGGLVELARWTSHHPFHRERFPDLRERRWSVQGFTYFRLR